MENLIKMDDFGVPLFWKHPYQVYMRLIIKGTCSIPPFSRMIMGDWNRFPSYMGILSFMKATRISCFKISGRVFVVFVHRLQMEKMGGACGIVHWKMYLYVIYTFLGLTPLPSNILTTRMTCFTCFFENHPGTLPPNKNLAFKGDKSPMPWGLYFFPKPLLHPSSGQQFPAYRHLKNFSDQRNTMMTFSQQKHLQVEWMMK